MKKQEDNLYDIIEATMALIKGRIPPLRRSVSSIIRNKVTSETKIEKLLDELLDYVPHGLGEKEFKKLNQYYAGINQESAQSYERDFNEALQRQ